MADNKGKHPGGRPTKYKAEYCDSIISYFDLPPQQTTYKRTYYANGQLKSEEPCVLAEQLPTVEGFAHSISVHKDTLYEWASKHKEFSVALARARQLQEKIWLVNAMGGQYNAQFAQFFGKNCLGYKDKSETELSGDMGVKVTLDGDIKDWAK